MFGLTTEKGSKEKMDKTIEGIKTKAAELLRENGVTDENAIKSFVDKLYETDEKKVEGQSGKGAENAGTDEKPADKPEDEKNPKPGAENPNGDGKADPNNPNKGPVAPQVPPIAPQPEAPKAAPNFDELMTKISDQEDTIKGLKGRLDANEEVLSAIASKFGIEGAHPNVAFGGTPSPELHSHSPNDSDQKEYDNAKKRVGGH